MVMEAFRVLEADHIHGDGYRGSGERWLTISTVVEAFRVLAAQDRTHARRPPSPSSFLIAVTLHVLLINPAAN